MSKSFIISLFACFALAACSTRNLDTSAAAKLLIHGDAALPDGSVYSGSFKDGLFDGKGVLLWGNGSKYEGEFKSGLRHGEGVLTLATGNVYKGRFIDGQENGRGVLEMVSGDRYEGSFNNGLFHGQGIYEAKNGDTFIGDFIKGEFSGQGRFVSEFGEQYEGEFLRWAMHGQGTLRLESGETYSGRFEDGDPMGQMVVEYHNGDRYQGGMVGWNLHGEGIYVGQNGYSYSGTYEDGRAVGIMIVENKENGTLYEGELENWIFHGQGELRLKDGARYDGDFRYGRFDGTGKLITSDGKTYSGEFRFGKYHGDGTLDYRDQNGETKTLSGRWKNGKYAGDDAARFTALGLSRLNAEQVLFEQPKQIETVLARLAPQVSGRPDLYFIGFGSFGSEDVFMNEIHHSSHVMNELYQVGSRTVSMINNVKTVNDVPLATVTNLEAVLNGVSKQMDVEEDILFLYVTSHGSKEHELAVSLDGMPLQSLPVNLFKQIIIDSGIKWKVLVVSACYSGGFLEALKDDHTMVMTAARADRQSFGCGDDSDLTYFGRAFFDRSLTSGSRFVDAFKQARNLVSDWEKEEGRVPSEPQISSTSLIEEKLSQWHDRIVKEKKLR